MLLDAHRPNCPKLRSLDRYCDCACTIEASARELKALKEVCILALNEQEIQVVALLIYQLGLLPRRLRTLCMRSNEHLMSTTATMVLRIAFPRLRMEGPSSTVNL